MPAWGEKLEIKFTILGHHVETYVRICVFEAQKFMHLRAILVDFPDTNHQELPGAWLINPWGGGLEPARPGVTIPDKHEAPDTLEEATDGLKDVSWRKTCRGPSW